MAPIEPAESNVALVALFVILITEGLVACTFPKACFTIGIPFFRREVQCSAASTTLPTPASVVSAMASSKFRPPESREPDPTRYSICEGDWVKEEDRALADG